MHFHIKHLQWIQFQLNWNTSLLMSLHSSFITILEFQSMSRTCIMFSGLANMNLTMLNPWLRKKKDINIPVEYVWPQLMHVSAAWGGNHQPELTVAHLAGLHPTHPILLHFYAWLASFFKTKKCILQIDFNGKRILSVKIKARIGPEVRGLDHRMQIKYWINDALTNKRPSPVARSNEWPVILMHRHTNRFVANFTFTSCLIWKCHAQTPTTWLDQHFEYAMQSNGQIPWT